MVKYNQHFLNNEKILSDISKNIDSNKDNNLIEIGPGKGSLTKHLVDKDFKKLYLVEIDINQLNNLEKFKSKNVEIINDSILNIGFSKDDFVVGNIPYDITQPLYDKLIINLIEKAVLLHGYDFYKTITSRESKWYYIVNSFYNIEKISLVEGSLFEPKTKVYSVILKLILKKEISTSDLFWREFYFNKNSKLKNNLVSILTKKFGYTKNQVRNLLSDELLEIREKVSSQLSRNEFLEFLDFVKRKKLI